MDLETHDVLLGVLPAMYGDTYLSQENRPENMGFYDFVVSEIHGIRPMELLEHQKKGGKVLGTFCVYVPDEVAAAAGAAVTGLCGGSQFWVPGGEKVLPKKHLPAHQGVHRRAAGQHVSFLPHRGHVYRRTTCDGKKKAWEILSEEVPVHIMDLPQMKRPQDIEKWADEIRIFIGVVEELTGTRSRRKTWAKPSSSSIINGAPWPASTTAANRTLSPSAARTRCL
jgi:benzoyl-CoA reductase/2-hydroxyglutaryl-CoA dehydratase subunit BcrC/BadD/HgdB